MLRKKRIILGVLLIILGVNLACSFPPLLLWAEGGSTTQERLIAYQTALAAAGMGNLEATPIPEINTAPTVEIPTTVPTAEVAADLPVAPDGMLAYWSQPGDTLEAVALRFETEVNRIGSDVELPEQGLLPVGTVLYIPDYPFEVMADIVRFPDAGVVWGRTASDFDLYSYIQQSGGYLSRYGELAKGKWMDGAGIVDRVAKEHSINPKLLLAILEYRSGWVRGEPREGTDLDYPIGYHVVDYHGLYGELYLVGRMLGKGYYGWREGSDPLLHFPDGSERHLDPTLNAGTAAVYSAFASMMNEMEWREVFYGSELFFTLYEDMFGVLDLSMTAREAHLPSNLTQPDMRLPFNSIDVWHLTGGPHMAWGTGSPWAALDFAPQDFLKGCVVSPMWATAAADGLVIRTQDMGVVVIDLDQDGQETTGWVLFYLHIATEDKIETGTIVRAGDPIGHASCEGGASTGSHIHIARKYNGEWIAADGPIPFVLDGWRAENGAYPYGGLLERDGQMVFARSSASSVNEISRSR